MQVFARLSNPLVPVALQQPVSHNDLGIWAAWSSFSNNIFSDFEIQDAQRSLLWRNKSSSCQRRVLLLHFSRSSGEGNGEPQQIYWCRSNCINAIIRMHFAIILLPCRNILWHGQIPSKVLGSSGCSFHFPSVGPRVAHTLFTDCTWKEKYPCCTPGVVLQNRAWRSRWARNWM